LCCFNLYSYKDAAIKKKGIDVLNSVDQQRYNLLQEVSDSLPEEEQFEFYLFESFLEMADRKGETKANCHYTFAYDVDGNIARRWFKKDLKKKRNTFKNLITASFNPKFACTEEQLDMPDVWGGKGEVNEHFDDYGDEDMDFMFSRLKPAGYNPFWSSDESPEPRHKTTTYRSHFLVFWPRVFDTDNFNAMNGISNNTTVNPGDLTAAASAETNTQAAAAAAAKPVKKSGKPKDFAAEYAKTSRAHCRVCKAQISKDVLRMSIMVQKDVFKNN
jgi:hypothetical protein